MENVIGKTYGLLTVLAEAERAGRTRRVLVRCACEEAIEKVVRLCHIRSGVTTSCGCVRIAAAKVNGALSVQSCTTHGLSNHKLYSTWQQMRQRCQSPTNKNYATYGGAGIAVCERWQKAENFIADMGPTYREGLTLDRRDNSQGYNPDNCRWATRVEQGRNRNNNVNLTLNGRRQCLKAWCEELNLKYSTVKLRIRKGKTPEQALTT